MPPFLPKPFRSREKVLSLLAAAFAIVSVVLCALAGIGALVAWIFLTAIGTLVFLIMGGRARIFLTTLFSLLTYFGNLGAAMVYVLWIERTDAREPFDTETMLALLMMLVACVGLPVGIAWLVTWFTSHKSDVV